MRAEQSGVDIIQALPKPEWYAVRIMFLKSHKHEHIT